MTQNATIAIIGLCITFAMLIVAIIVHAVATAWWASRLTTKVEGVEASVGTLNVELTKRDAALAAQWKKIDDLHTRVTTIEALQSQAGHHA